MITLQRSVLVFMKIILARICQIKERGNIYIKMQNTGKVFSLSRETLIYQGSLIARMVNRDIHALPNLTVQGLSWPSSQIPSNWQIPSRDSNSGQRNDLHPKRSECREVKER